MLNINHDWHVIILSMIGHIKGKIIFKNSRFAVVEVSGVGYKIFLPLGLLNKIVINEDVDFWTHLHVREDALDLFGFLNHSELEFFEALISISGIGPRSALGVLALASVDVLKRAISSGDTSYLTKVSGIGKKTADKIVLELKDKLGGGAGENIESVLSGDADILDALISLGYSQREARDMISKIPEEIVGSEQRLKEALKSK